MRKMPPLFLSESSSQLYCIGYKFIVGFIGILTFVCLPLN